MFRFTVDKTDLAKLDAFLEGARLAQDNRDPVATMLNVYGLYTDKNFESRGMEFGQRWQNISQYTQEIRKKRGQSPIAPPLHGSGWLRNVTGFEMSRWHPDRPPRTFTDYPVAPDSDGRTTLNVSVMARQATLHMVGPKASHMTGDTSLVFIPEDIGRFGVGYMPARPFWGLNQGVMDTMSQGAVAGYFRAWANTAEKMGAGRVLYSTPGFASLRWMAL